MDADVVIIGAGAIGLAIACKLSDKGYSIILLEKETKFGTGISSRNSEVIHAGVYYKTGSLKADLCLKGKNLLYEHCKKHKVEFKKIGKLFIAVTKDETARLELTNNQAKNNGIEDLIELNQKDLRKLEPELNCHSALLSPSSGIFDTYGFLKSLILIAEQNGVIFVPLSPVDGGEPIPGGWKIHIGGNDPTFITTRVVINSAGLCAIELSNIIFSRRKIPKLYPTKGSYLRFSGISPLKHIVYPAIIPGKIEERIDATPDLAKGLRFGPNSEEAKNLEDFSVNEEIIPQMLHGIKRYLPNIKTSQLLLDIAGIRPKIYGQNDAVADFTFDWSENNRWLDLWGMESPALTASLSIGDHVLEILSSKQILV